jgi:hypothetical protein
MRTLATITAICLALPAGADEPKKDDKPKDADWTKVSEAGKFEIEFPGKPTEKAAATGTQYLLQKTSPTALYLATAAPLPGKVDLTDDKAVKTVFDNAVASTQKGLGGKVVSDKEAKVADKYPARDIDLQSPAIGLFRARLILTPTGFIQVIVAGPKEFVDGADAKRFRESLKITAKE